MASFFSFVLIVTEDIDIALSSAVLLHGGKLFEELLHVPLIMIISDNGASPEGGLNGTLNENDFFNFIPTNLEDNLAKLDTLGSPENYNHYAWGWANAGNTPFKRWKKETFRGGTSDPFVVSWPAKIDANGEWRHQYGHAIDMVPTVLDLLDIDPPESEAESISGAMRLLGRVARRLRLTTPGERRGHERVDAREARPPEVRDVSGVPEVASVPDAPDADQTAPRSSVLAERPRVARVARRQFRAASRRAADECNPSPAE